MVALTIAVGFAAYRQYRWTAMRAMRKTLMGSVILLLAANVLVCDVLADRWGPPVAKTALSPAGEYEVHVVPRATGPALLSLWRRSTKAKVYEVTAVNRESPVDVVVADSGHVLTLDEWGAMGHDHAAVLYNERGRVVRDWRLRDLLTEGEIKEKVQLSVTSIHWRYDLERPAVTDGWFNIATRFGETVRISTKDGSIGRRRGKHERLLSHIKQGRNCARPEIRVVRKPSTSSVTRRLAEATGRWQAARS